MDKRITEIIDFYWGLENGKERCVKEVLDLIAPHLSNKSELKKEAVEDGALRVAVELQKLFREEREKVNEFKLRRTIAETFKELIAYTYDDSIANANQMISELNKIIGKQLEANLSSDEKEEHGEK